MCPEDLTNAAKNDTILVKVRGKMIQKHGHMTHSYSHVRQKIRELARLEILLRKVD